MITYIRYKTAEFLKDVFDPVLNSPKDIVHQPVDTALEKRLDDAKDTADNQYIYPFISFWDDPTNLNENRYNHVLSAHNGACITLNGNQHRVKFYPVEYNIELQFWAAQEKDVVHSFNRLWVSNRRSGSKKTIELPFLNPDDTETSDSLDFDLNYNFGELTDNSAIERQYQTGVFFRLTGEITAPSAIIFDPELPDEYPKIQTIFVNYLEQVDGVDNNLLEQVTIT